MKIDSNLKVRNVMGEHVVLMQGDMTRVLSLNETSLMLWEELQGRDFETEDVTRLLLDNYDVEEAVASRDAAAWVEKLQGCGAII